jgi:hypothetical protein
MIAATIHATVAAADQGNVEQQFECDRGADDFGEIAGE